MKQKSFPLKNVVFAPPNGVKNITIFAKPYPIGGAKICL
jgi:hypothetical protein